MQLKSAANLNSTPPTASEKAAGEMVARALALALQDAEVRQEIKQALASSAAREHKLELVSFLQGRGGKIFLAAQRAGGITELQLQQAIASLRPLEFYMPVVSHQKVWSGGTDLVVALVIHKSQTPLAFSLDGSSRALDPATPPSVPALVLTQVETHFGEQVTLNRAGVAQLFCSVSASATLAAANQRCDAAGVKVSGMNPNRASQSMSAPTTAAMDFGTDPQVVGLYATFFRALDVKEMWYQGSPEVEIHVTGKRNGPAGAPIDYQCSGQFAGNATGFQPGIRDYSYVFSMNGDFWQGQPEVRILSGKQIDTLLTHEPDGFIVALWEDDDVACQTKQAHSNFFADAVRATELIANGVNAILPIDSIQYRLLPGHVQQFADFLIGDDSYIGTLVDTESTPKAGMYPDNTHVIYDGNTFNGRATIYLKTVARTTALSGTQQTLPNSTEYWSSSASGTEGTVTYSWSIDGEGVQSGTNSGFQYQNTGSSFYLSVSAADSYGVVGTNAVWVNVGEPEPCPPPQITCEPYSRQGGDFTGPSASGTKLGNTARPTVLSKPRTKSIVR